MRSAIRYMFRNTEHNYVDNPTRLARRLDGGDAVAVGLAAMLPGIFVALGPAVGAAGWLAPAALLIAAGVAYCNARSCAQLAVRHPASGGAYMYGRAELGPMWGFVAGVAFLIGKTAAAAALATLIGAELAPGAARPAALLGVGVLVGVNLFGIRGTAVASRVGALAALASLCVAALAGVAGRSAAPAASGDPVVVSIPSLLGGAGLLFFAFGGYARIATLGEEVRDPSRTIPRAIPLALAVAVAVYLLFMSVALAVLGPDRLAASAMPHAELTAGTGELVAGVVRGAAVVAATGVVLSLLVGLSRTVFAMAATGDLPRPLAVVHPGRLVPARADLAVGLVVAALAISGSATTLVRLASFSTLVYYGIANLAALALPRDSARCPSLLPVGGLTGCAVLALSLPGRDSALTAAVLIAAAVGHRLMRRPSKAPTQKGSI